MTAEIESGAQPGAQRAPSAAPSAAPVTREIRAWEIDHSVRHQTIFAVLDELHPGEAVRLRVDHEPKPLFYMVQAERAGRFAWEPEQEGPDEWVVRISRLDGDGCC
jgi:uncharacterized protein (DUF2249 family)